MTDQKGNFNTEEQRKAVENMHNTFLEALRHREQEILRFIAILAPALGGFLWLLKEVDLKSEKGPFIFTIGTLGVLFLLGVGAVYSVALGYNFRYVTFQLAKLELPFCLNIEDFILDKWPRRLNGFKIYIFKFIPWCTPPEIIKVFWLAFVIAILGVTVIARYFLSTECGNMDGQIRIILIVGGILFVIAWPIAPFLYGRKLHEYCDAEDPEKWNVVAPDKKE